MQNLLGNLTVVSSFSLFASFSHHCSSKNSEKKKLFVYHVPYFQYSATFFESFLNFPYRVARNVALRVSSLSFNDGNHLSDGFWIVFFVEQL